MSVSECTKILTALKRPFDASAISWRVGSTNQDKTKGMALGYIDARDVMDRLDEACGAGNWSDEYVETARGRIICRIGIKIDGEWVWKSDGAGDTGTEAEKGAISDAFKRAAVKWGVARYLYALPTPWVGITQRGKSYAIAPDQLAKLETVARAPLDKWAEQLKAIDAGDCVGRQSAEPPPPADRKVRRAGAAPSKPAEPTPKRYDFEKYCGDALAAIAAADTIAEIAGIKKLMFAHETYKALRECDAGRADEIMLAANERSRVIAPPPTGREADGDPTGGLDGASDPPPPPPPPLSRESGPRVLAIPRVTESDGLDGAQTKFADFWKAVRTNIKAAPSRDAAEAFCNANANGLKAMKKHTGTDTFGLIREMVNKRWPIARSERERAEAAPVGGSPVAIPPPAVNTPGAWRAWRKAVSALIENDAASVAEADAIIEQNAAHFDAADSFIGEDTRAYLSIPKNKKFAAKGPTR